MHWAQNQHENTYDEVQIRDIAEQYIRTQENTQFLTNIVRHQQGRSFQLFNYDIPNIQLKSFFNLIVQTSYLLYTCYVRKVALYFSKNLYVAFQKEGSAEVIMEFLLEKQWLRFDQNKKKEIQMNFYYINISKYDNVYAQNVLNCIKSNLQKISQYIKRQKQRKLASDRSLSRPIDSLDKAYGLLSSIAQKGIKPKALISCLQQTQIFRTYSYLLKTLNSSLYQATRKTGKFEQIIQQIKRKQLIFNQNFMIARQDSLDSQSLQYCLEDFLNYLIGKHLIQMEISTKSKSTSVEVTKQKSQVKLGTFQVFKHGKYQDRVCLWKILVEQKRMRQFNQKILLELTEGDATTVYSSNQKDHKIQNLFYIEYMAKRNLISVEYISNVEVNVESTDALIYHCSNMMLQLNNVVVEHIERQPTKNNKRKARVLAFKVTQYLNPKQNPFINIMLMIDRAMIYGKVCQPQIMKKITKIDDYTRFNVVGKRINHLSNLFIKKVRRLYQNIGVKNKQN